MSFLRSCIRAFLSVFPKNPKKVIFESHSDFCDNSRALYEYLAKEKPDIRAVWCVSQPSAFSGFQKNGGYPKFINPRSKKSLIPWLFHIATSGTIFYSHVKPPFCDTKKQRVVCLWHGIPLKKISLYGDTPENAFTYLPTSGEFYTRVMKDCFKAEDGQFVSTGFPRNDLLFDSKAGADALSRLLIKREEYPGGIIVWMPTFRQHKESGYSDAAATATGLPLFTNEKALSELIEQLKRNKQLMILKLHPAQDLSFIKVDSLSNLMLLTNTALDKAGVQLYHLLAGSDALLTDYSSVYFDYLLLNRPIGFIVDDMAEYIKNRGFVTDKPEELMPGAKMTLTKELFEWLDKIVSKDDGYKKERMALIPKIYDNPDDKACERMARLMLGFEKE